MSFSDPFVYIITTGIYSVYEEIVSIIFMFNSHKGNFMQRMCIDLSLYKILHAFHQTENEVQISGRHVTVLHDDNDSCLYQTSRE
jgi:hypothetical protein